MPIQSQNSVSSKVKVSVCFYGLRLRPPVVLPNANVERNFMVEEAVSLALCVNSDKSCDISSKPSTPESTTSADIFFAEARWYDNKWYHVRICEQLPNGQYKCCFTLTNNIADMPANRLRNIVSQLKTVSPPEGTSKDNTMSSSETRLETGVIDKHGNDASNKKKCDLVFSMLADVKSASIEASPTEPSAVALLFGPNNIHLKALGYVGELCLPVAPYLSSTSRSNAAMDKNGKRKSDEDLEHAEELMAAFWRSIDDTMHAALVNRASGDDYSPDNTTPLKVPSMSLAPALLVPMGWTHPQSAEDERLAAQAALKHAKADASEWSHNMYLRLLSSVASISEPCSLKVVEDDRATNVENHGGGTYTINMPFFIPVDERTSQELVHVGLVRVGEMPEDPAHLSSAAARALALASQDHFVGQRLRELEEELRANDIYANQLIIDLRSNLEACHRKETERLNKQRQQMQQTYSKSHFRTNASMGSVAADEAILAKYNKLMKKRAKLGL